MTDISITADALPGKSQQLQQVNNGFIQLFRY
jgi:hypothetical protein